MLTKFKKYFKYPKLQESFTGCYKLVSATFYGGPLNDLPSYGFSYSLCNSEKLDSISLLENVRQDINLCIDPQSIDIESITPYPTNEEIDEAILNNEGIITFSLADGENNLYGKIKFVFDYCDSSPNPSSDLFIGAVSADTLVDPINVCNTLELFDVVYIKQQNIGYITNGDLVFYNHRENLPFIGNGEYYKIKASNSQIHAATITPE